MFCPQCRAEYREGFTECPDCGALLVTELPPEPEPEEEESLELTTVLVTGNPVVIALAKSLLDDAEIRYSVKGEGLQEVYGAGRIGSGYNVIFGPVQIQVLRDDEAVAREVLQGLEENGSEESI